MGVGQPAPIYEGTGMRFLSHIKRYGMQVRPLREMALADGRTQSLTEPIYVEFRSGDVYPHEIEAAKASFGMHGGKVMLDQVTPVDILTRLSIFDTDAAAEELGWDAETKAFVEERMLSRVGRDMIMVPEPTVEAPWPSYDDYPGEASDLAKKCLIDGHDLHLCVLYEQDNQNRADVLAALQYELSEREALGEAIVR